MSVPVEPKRIAALRHDSVGHPVPWFVPWVDGKPDFRLMDEWALVRAVREGRCWVCGQKRRGPTSSFAVGSMCAVNRTSAEPPSHHECATYSALVCPFLTNPGRQRRDGNMPDEAHAPGGLMIRRNPGVTCIWTSRHWDRFSDGRGGVLFDIGEPTRVEWYAEGRTATQAEVLASIKSGLPLLREQCDGQDDEQALAALVDVALGIVARTSAARSASVLEGPE